MITTIITIIVCLLPLFSRAHRTLPHSTHRAYISNGRLRPYPPHLTALNSQVPAIFNFPITLPMGRLTFPVPDPDSVSFRTGLALSASCQLLLLPLQGHLDPGALLYCCAA